MKKIPGLLNMFRSRPNVGELETDAVAVDDPPDGLDSTYNNTPLNSGDLNAALELQSQMAESGELAMFASNSSTAVIESPANSITNNQTAVHNTQQQLVMNFSHVNGLHFGSVYNINSEKLGKVAATEPLPGSATRTAGSGRPPRTRTIEEMMKSSEELNHRMMDTISTHLGEGWKNVLRELGLTHGQIEQAVIDHQVHGGIKEVIYQMLLAWTRNADDGEATLGMITQILWSTGHRECVHKMKEAYKLENPTRNVRSKKT